MPQIINNVIPEPVVHEKVVETVVERPRVVEIDKVITLDKEIPKLVEVEGPERTYEIVKPEIVEVVKEVIVKVVEEHEVIKPVDRIVEKIV